MSCGPKRATGYHLVAPNKHIANRERLPAYSPSSMLFGHAKKQSLVHETHNVAKTKQHQLPHEYVSIKPMKESEFKFAKIRKKSWKLT